MLIENNAYDVTLAPSATVTYQDSTPVHPPNNLTGMGLNFQNCFAKNRIYQNHGSVCRSVMTDCMGGCVTDSDSKKINDFCGQTVTKSFYRNGAWWSMN